ncbi:MAG: hypothetical protein A4E71_00096 [Smithella sp. PtaU1.Bin162]|nr:MAG: hypothetical protein A4E71_00096 [Smithella sp. PtaU1.Bin162]
MSPASVLATYMPRAFWRPMFSEAVCPTFRILLIKTILSSRYSLIILRVLSLLPSLTIINSKSLNVCDKTVSMVGVRYFSPLYTAITTDIVGVVMKICPLKTKRYPRKQTTGLNDTVQIPSLIITLYPFYFLIILRRNRRGSFP